jgi:Ca2+-binding RTX toxin-like protein
VITVSDAGTSIGDPNVQILDRLPLFTSGLNLSGADLGADLFILGLAPSAITIRADELNGGSTGGFNIRTSSGNDTVYITGTADGSANSVDSLTNLSTGLGDDTVVVNLSSNDDGRLIINTQGDYTHRMILNAGIDLESLVSSLNEVEVYLDGVSIPVENIRVVPSQNAIDLNLDSSVGIVRPDSIVTAVVSKELNDRLEVEPRQRRYNIDHTLKTNEAVSLYSAGNQLEEGRDFFIIPGVDTFEVLFSLFFNLYINTDITYKIVESISESVPIAQVTLSDRDYVDAVRSGFGLTIHTGVGADLIKGSSYDDVIYAGSGDDLIFGNEGNDIIYGDDLGSLFSGDDVVFGGVGSITVMESGTSRTINGRVANQPGLSNDGLAFMVRAESDVNESAGSDTLYAGGGNNLVFGGAGNDVIVSTDGHDIILGDHGRVDYTDFRPSVVDSTTSNFVVGGDDTIASSGGINWIIAGTGTDNVTTGSGDDVVLGDLGIIEFEYDILTDSFLIESLISTDVASGANDVLLLGAGYNLAIAGYGLDRIETSGFGSYTMLTGGTLRFSAGSLLSAMQYKPLNDPYYPGSSLGNVINLDGILLERVAVVLNLQIGTEEEDGV